MKLSELLQSEMDSRGWKAYRLAQESGLSTTAIDKILSGQSMKITHRTKELLSSALGGNLLQAQYGNWTFTPQELNSAGLVLEFMRDRNPHSVERRVVFTEEFITSLGDIPEELRRLLQNDRWCTTCNITEIEARALATQIQWQGLRFDAELVEAFLYALRTGQRQSQKKKA